MRSAADMLNVAAHLLARLRCGAFGHATYLCGSKTGYDRRVDVWRCRRCDHFYENIHRWNVIGRGR